MPTTSPIPAILDTDIGGDIDDTWALAMLLNSPELDLKLLTTCTADTEYRAAIAARLLEIANRSSIPLGIGLKQPSDGPRERQKEWVAHYPLHRYPGPLHHDGIAAMIDVIMTSKDPITLISIGPLTNIAEALRRQPQIAPRTRLVAMAGSLQVHHRTNLELSVEPGQIAEWNIVKDIPAAQAVFDAPWHQGTITPLDTCAHIVLDGPRYQQLLAARTQDPTLQAVFDNYRIWHTHCPCRPDRQTTVLYDTVAVYLAYDQSFCHMRQMHLKVDAEGFLREDPQARPIQVAESWRDLEAYLTHLTTRLINQ